MGSLHVELIREEFTEYSACSLSPLPAFSMIYRFSQGIHFSPSVAIWRPNLVHIYLYIPVKSVLFRGFCSDVEAEQRQAKTFAHITSLCAVNDQPVATSPQPYQAQELFGVHNSGFYTYVFPYRHGYFIFHAASKRWDGTLYKQEI